MSLIYLSCDEPKEEDTTPPTVSIQSPISSSTVGEIITIQVSSEDNKGILKVDFYIDDLFVHSDSLSPYEYLWNTTEYEDGNYVIKVISYDLSENDTESQPIPVTINNQNFLPTNNGIISIIFKNGGLEILWNKSSDSDFGQYLVEKSIEQSFSNSNLVFYSDNINDTIYFDEFIDPLGIQYYRLIVHDTLGLKNISEVYSSSPDPIPDPVDVISVSYDTSSMIIQWEESEEDDFSEYVLYRSTGDSSNYSSITIITDIHTTLYSINEFDPLQVNYFRVSVYDTLGQYSIGNYYTNDIDSPPNSVDITSVTYTLDEMTIQWEEYVPNLSRILIRTPIGTVNDFVSYELLYSETENGVRTVVSSITDQSVLSYSITDFDPTHKNWFWVRVNDYWGLTSIGSGMTNSIDLPPSPVDVVSVTYDTSEMVVTWEQSTDDDFSSYKLYYSSTEFGTQELIESFTDISTTLFSISDFDPTYENWFWVVVKDYWGLITVGQGLTNEIEDPPSSVTLYPIIFQNNEFIITWSQNNDVDFSSYKLYESLSQNMSEKTLIYDTFSRSDTTHTIQNISIGNHKYYQLNVYDYFFSESVSDIILGNSYNMFVSTFGGSNRDYGNQGIETQDGGYIITGTTYSFGNGDSDVWLIKTNSMGVEEWNQTYGGSERDGGNSVQQTDDGGFIISGGTQSFGNGWSDVWLIKTNSIGVEEWNQTFGGIDGETGWSVQQTDDGGYIITGTTYSFGNGDKDVWLIKTNSMGVEEWNQTFGGVGRDVGYSVQQTSDGGFIITGETEGISNDSGYVWLIKTNSVGVEEWNQSYGGNQREWGQSLQETSDGGFIILGSTYSYGSGGIDIWLIKTNSVGVEEWNQTYGGINGDLGFSVQQSQDGGYILVGYTESFESNGSDIWLIKTNYLGEEEWSQFYGGNLWEHPKSVQQTSDEGFIIIGYTESFGNGQDDIWLIKTDPLGNTSPY